MLRRWPIVGVVAGLLTCLLQVVVAPSALAATGTTTTSVTVRSGPGDANASVGTIAASTTVSFHCYVAGESVTGKYGTEDLWDALDSGGYVPDALVYTGSNAAVVSACPSSQFGTGHYPVAWTGGAGMQPRSGTSTSTGAEGAVLPDGEVVTVTCETSGQTLTDSKGFVSDLWDQLTSGGYIPNVYIDTQINGATPGLSACSAPSGGSGTSGGSGSSGQGNGSTGGTSSNSGSASSSGDGNNSSPDKNDGSNDKSASCPQPSGTLIPNQSGLKVPYALYDHYMWGNGTPVVIAWSFFSESASFARFAKSLSISQSAPYRDRVNTALFYALGTFTVTRISTSCYSIFDHYDFTPTSAVPKLPDTILTLPEWAYQLSGSKEFYIRAAGRL